MENLLQDARYALRGWLRRPGFTALIIVTLALGIGANSAVFSVIDGVLLRPLPYPDPQQLVLIRTELPEQGGLFPKSSGPEILDLKERAGSLETIGAIWARPAALTDDESEPEEIEMGFVTAGFLSVLGVEPLLGRDISPEEDVLGAPQVIVLSHGLWQRRYGGQTDVVGKTIEMDGISHTVVGVMPERFAMWMPPDSGVPKSLQAWVPWGGGYEEMSRSFRVFTVVGRLRPELDVEKARSELSDIAVRIAADFSADYERSGFRLHLEPLHDDVTAPVRPALLVLWATVGFVLLIACANVTNLLLVRATGMEREMVLRTALGASRRRVMRQVVTESMLLAALGGALGLVLARWGIVALEWLRPGELPRLEEVDVGVRAVLFATVAVTLAGAVIGLLAAFHLSPGQLPTGLKGRSIGEGARHRLRGMLVVGEVALALVLLVGAGLLFKTFVSLSSAELGYRTEGVTTLKLSLIDSAYSYRDPAKIAGFYRSLVERVSERSGVTAVGASTQLPLDGFSNRTAPYAYETEDDIIEWDTVTADYRTVTPGFLEALGVPLLEGRLFDWTDDMDHPNVVVVDEKLAALAWPLQPAVGKRLQVLTFLHGEFRPTWSEVIGVVGHVRNHPGIDGPEQVFLPQSQSPQRTMTLAVRSGLPVETLSTAIRAEVARLEPTQPIHAIQPMEEYRAGAVAENRFTMLALGAFSSVALVLASLGLYGTIAFTVGRRTREIGIRLALGATPRDILRDVLAQGLRLVGAGLVLGMALALTFTRVLEGLLFGVSSRDPLTFVAMPLLLVAVALAACYLPGRRAASSHPAMALREE
ncbi:MAG TPA: ABC transporter permease [Vicinamibacteria bacterium]|nr:ABC transporter permease [Vicinamibacteria bacterium]